MDVSMIETLIDEHGKDIYNFCRKLTYSEFDAEELYQDTFLKAKMLLPFLMATNLARLP